MGNRCVVAWERDFCEAFLVQPNSRVAFHATGKVGLEDQWERGIEIEMRGDESLVATGCTEWLGIVGG